MKAKTRQYINSNKIRINIFIDSHNDSPLLAANKALPKLKLETGLMLR